MATIDKSSNAHSCHFESCLKQHKVTFFFFFFYNNFIPSSNPEVSSVSGLEARGPLQIVAVSYFTNHSNTSKCRYICDAGVAHKYAVCFDTCCKLGKNYDRTIENNLSFCAPD